MPIDACYRLVGLVRLHWRGFDGGSEAWAAIDTFFAELNERARRAGRWRLSVLRFACTGSRPEPHAAGPALQLDLRVEDGTGRRVHAVALRVQIRIDPRPRRYTAEETARLTDLFGEPNRWGDTLQPAAAGHRAGADPVVHRLDHGRRSTCR